ncbi:hypothetical protein BC826DRAFT_628397 [Russula brevipes]|nr:hypothetical protein BC826DRAFT_628397 [Russula brevipes]
MPPSFPGQQSVPFRVQWVSSICNRTHRCDADSEIQASDEFEYRCLESQSVRRSPTIARLP